MAPLLKHERSAAKEHNREINYRACDHLTKVGNYFAQLSKSGLWPITQQFHETSFVKIIAQSSKLKGYWDGNVTRGSYSQHCSSPNFDVKQLREQFAHNACKNLKGLCLNCVKHGRYTRKDPNCHQSKRQACEA